MKQHVRNSAKIALAIATILGAGWAIVTLSHRGNSVGVQEAEADIWGLNFGERSKHEKFVGAMEELGMEPPRAYDWNGNRVYFSTATTQESPRQVMRRFQEEFVRRGLNKRVHTRAPGPEKMPILESQEAFDRSSTGEKRAALQQTANHMEWLDDFWAGGLVPTEVGADRVAMIGTLTQSDESSAAGVVGELIKKGHAGPDDAVKAMRYVDAWREPGGRTRISSVWSDEELNLSKLGPNAKYEDRTYGESRIPACMGCTRLMRFQGTGPEEKYTATIYKGTSDPKGVFDFYDEAMVKRGWQQTEAMEILEIAQREGMVPAGIDTSRVYVKGGIFTTVTAQRDGPSTLVQVMEMP